MDITASGGLVRKKGAPLVANNRNKSKTEQPRPVHRLTAQEAADILGVSSRQILRWAQERLIACVRLGPRCIRFDPHDIEGFASRRRVSAQRGA